MHKRLINGGLAVSLFALIATGADAQTPPPALSGVTGIAFEGQVGGMDVWSAPGMTDLFAVTPDGRTILRGLIFSGAGRDIGSAFTGAAPGNLQGVAQDVEPLLSEQGLQNGILMVNTSTFEDFSGLRGPDTCQSPIMGSAPSIGSPEVAGWDEAGRGNPTSVQPSTAPSTGITPPLDEVGLIDGAQVAKEAQNALEGFDQEEKRKLLLDLVNGLRSASTQEEFLQGVASWRSEIDKKRVEKGMSRLYSEGGSAPLPPVAAFIPVTTLAPPEVITTPLPPSEMVVAGTETPLEQTLLEDVRKNALWFSVGANDAPTVYAFIDPTCMYSASAIAALSKKVGAGELQLRVVLAPVISERSPGLIAAILNSDRPPLTFFDHEVALAEQGRSDLVPGALTDLPGPVQAGIQKNFDMVRDYGIPGVPFFVYETTEGAKVLSGSPEGIDFPGAVSDPYMGKN